MKKEDLNNLLTDLYNFYNPDYIQYVPELTEKYHRMEHSAVEMILLKYNHKNSPFYDPKKSEPNYVLELVKEYEDGLRTLQNLKPQVVKKEEEVKKDLMAENAQKISQEVDKKIEEVKNEVDKKDEELKRLISQYEETMKVLNEKMLNQKPATTSYFDVVDIKINLFYTESEVKLPNKEILASLGIGSRILVLNKENKPIGLEVREITYDCISNMMIGGKPTLEITLDRV
jgi:vacuolar-type H+-ATPase subunit I/STV1